MRLPQKNGRIDEARAICQVRSAIDQGINYVDTAVPYHLGASEPFLGRALADGYREKVKIATKLPPWSVKTKEDMDGILASQLRKLRTDHIDYYLLHSLARNPWERLDALGVLTFLDATKADGRIINAGFSFHGDPETFKKIVDAYDWEFCQIQYNFLDETNQAGTEGLRYAAAQGLAVMVMEPLRGGRLANRIPDSVRAIQENATVRRTPAEWAFRWIWDHPEVTVVLSGMNEEAHIEENIRIAGDAVAGSLTPEEHAVMEQVRDAYRELMKVDCTGCGYCMPCPHGVNIPQCFSYYNNYHMFDDRGTQKRHYLARLGGIIADEGYAGLCLECGKCTKACPQNLPIPDLLREVAHTFEGRTFSPKVRIARWLAAMQGRLASGMSRQKNGNGG
jgi:predicted aldo/keto reductase-like oxidoreductase